MPQQMQAPEGNQAWAVIECFQIPLTYFNNKAMKPHSIHRITMTQEKNKQKNKSKKEEEGKQKKKNINDTRIPERKL